MVEVTHDVWQVDVATLAYWLAVIETLENAEQALVLLDVARETAWYNTMTLHLARNCNCNSLQSAQRVGRLTGAVKGVGHLGHDEAMEAGGREFEPRPTALQ